MHAFKDVRTTAGDASAKLILVTMLSRFILQGLNRHAGSIGALRANFNSIVNEIKASLPESIVYNEPAAKEKQKAYREAALTAYFEAYAETCKTFLKEVVPPFPVTDWAEEAEMSEAYFRVPSVKRHVGKVTPDVAGALEIAWLNVRRAQQRWVSWLCLGSMFKNTGAGQSQESIEQAYFQRVSMHLLQEVNEMVRRLVMFSLFQGGEQADAVRKWLLKTSFSRGMSVMEYLEVDGRMPGSWYPSDENSFRSSLANCAG